MSRIWGVERRKNKNEPWRREHGFSSNRSSAEKKITELQKDIAHRYISLASCLGPNKRRGTEGYQQKMALIREMEFEMENIRLIEERLGY